MRAVQPPIYVPRRGPWWRLPRLRWRDVLPAINNFFALPMRKDGLPLRKDGLPMNDAEGCDCCGSGSGSGPGPTIDGCGCSPQKAAYQYAITSFGIETCPEWVRTETSLPNLNIKHVSGNPNATTVVTYQGIMPFGFCFPGWCYWTAPIDLQLSAVGCFEGSLFPPYDTISCSGTVSLLIDGSFAAWIQITATGVFRQTGDSDPAHNHVSQGLYFMGRADFAQGTLPGTSIPILTDCHTTHTASNLFNCCRNGDCLLFCNPDPPPGIDPFPCTTSTYNNVAKNGTCVLTPL